MKKRTYDLSEKELVQLLMSDRHATGDIQAKLKRLFTSTIEQILETEMDEHLGYEKNAVAGNNSVNSRNDYEKKTITSEYGECEISVPRDRNGKFEPKVIEKRHTHTDKIEQKVTMNNGSMENFFGRLKVEIFYGEKFESVDAFIDKLKIHLLLQ